LRSCLPEAVLVIEDLKLGSGPDGVRVEYVQVYINPDAVFSENIDEDI
jgi:hypothetical protein